MRLKSVSNIAKITKSMKMIASTKMTKAQKLMEVARVYGAASNAVFEHAQTAPLKDEKTLAIAISSDRGLCGGIHSSVSKAVKAEVRGKGDTQVAIVGQKAKPQIAREAKNNIAITFDQVAKAMPTWDEAALIADAIYKTQPKNVKIFYNKFKSVIAFETVQVPAYSLDALLKSPKLSTYEYSDEVLDNFVQFAFANAVYAAIAEGNASEMAAKRTAMENATKNAGEMITKLTLTYNRSRQAAITNELVDIITGASAAV